MRPLVLLACSLITAACSSPEPPAARALGEAPRLVRIAPPDRPPPGSDAVPRVRVAFRMPNGALRPVDREAIAFVPRFADGAALVDPERRLHAVRPDGSRRMLASGATGSLAASPDGARLAYVVARGVLGELRTHDGRRERTLARGLASAGALRFAADGARLFFVGGRPGGVAGVWTSAVEGEARCLTNCALRTGAPWRGRFVPLPASAEALVPARGAVAWTDADGTAHRVALSRPGEPR